MILSEEVNNEELIDGFWQLCLFFQEEPWFVVKDSDFHCIFICWLLGLLNCSENEWEKYRHDRKKNPLVIIRFDESLYLYKWKKLKRILSCYYFREYLMGLFPAQLDGNCLVIEHVYKMVKFRFSIPSSATFIRGNMIKSIYVLWLALYYLHFECSNKTIRQKFVSAKPFLLW